MLMIINILILGKEQTKGLDKISLRAKTEDLINFSRSEINLCLSLYYNGSNNFLFINATKIYQFKQKILK